MKKNLYEWISTDPDCDQQGRQISDTIFEFEQEGMERRVIDLGLFDYDELCYAISGYYPSMDNLKELYKGDANWIIAECIFEMELYPRRHPELAGL